MDHNVPTWDRSLPITDPISRKQMETLAQQLQRSSASPYTISTAKAKASCTSSAPSWAPPSPARPSCCGDSHTSTHGAFGALAFGIGTSEVEHVLATQCLQQSKPQTMEIHLDGELPPGVTAKDVILAIIGTIGTDGATGHVIEYRGRSSPISAWKSG